jgi:hypothetical protein
VIPQSSFSASLTVGSAANPLNGERGVGGKWPYAGVPWPGAGEPSVAAVAGVRAVLGVPGPNKLGERPSPEEGPGAAKLVVDGVRPESGGGATGV